MKAKLSLYSLLLAMLFSLTLTAQDTPETEETGLPGDHFSLEGALELFKKSENLEDFEKALNTETNHVNNLDLNEDGDIDYIRVIDNMDEDVHAIVLQVPVSENESQDVAVIELEKTGKEEAMLQIIGNADVYGEDKIVEPFDEKANSGNGPHADAEMVRVVVNVFFWPSVRWVYRPGYRVYVSPYGWRVYPRYWRPWRPLAWHSYHVHCRTWRPHYRVTTTHRVVRAHKVYTPRRKSSTVVRTRTTTRVAARNGKVVGSKTTTKVAKGKNGAVAGKKSTTKVAKGKNGKVAGKRTTTKVKKGKNGNVGAKKSTTKVRKGKNGNVGAKKSTTKVRKGKNGGVAGKRTTTKVRKKKH